MTPSNIKNKRLVGIFLLGCMFFNYPILSLFNLDILVWGIPVLYVFLFSSWSLIIFFMVLATTIRPSATLPDRRETPLKPFESIPKSPPSMPEK